MRHKRADVRVTARGERCARFRPSFRHRQVRHPWQVRLVTLAPLHELVSVPVGGGEYAFHLHRGQALALPSQVDRVDVGRVNGDSCDAVCLADVRVEVEGSSSLVPVEVATKQSLRTNFDVTHFR